MNVAALVISWLVANPDKVEAVITDVAGVVTKVVGVVSEIKSHVQSNSTPPAAS